MKLEHHIAVSTIISGVLFAIFRSWGISTTAFVFGIFIDLDHAIDYVIDHGFGFNSEEFFSYFYGEKHQKIRLIFHGWEWLITVLIFALVTNWNFWATGMLIGYGHHIITDFIFNKAPFRSYSLVWKWKKGFDSEVIFPRDRGYNPNLFG